MQPTFLDHPVHYTIDEFRHCLAGLKLDGWKPAFPTLHNTGVPSLAQWMAMGATPQERWGASLDRYYKGLGWHAGPHLVVCPSYVWVLCDLAKSGVSVSCWNFETFGVEMVGNYEVGGDDFATGIGAEVRANAALVLADLAEKFGWLDLADFALGERGLHFHHDCAKDHHACPGSKVSKPDMLARIAAARAPLPLATPAAAPLPATPADHVTPAKIFSVSDIQGALNRLGFQPPLDVDGGYGPATHAAVRFFQEKHGLDVDGWAGPETCAQLVIALEPPIVQPGA